MKIIPLLNRLSVLLFAVAAVTSSIRAATVTWTGASAANQNWSTGGNWDTLAAPVAGDEVKFFDAGTDIPSLLDLTRSVGTLTYGQGNGGTHTTTINAGQTLTLNSVAGVADTFYVGTALPVDAGTLVPATILGDGGTLVMNGGNLVVRQAHATAGAHRATLDLSGLDTFTATLDRVLVGQGTGGNFNRTMGTLLLARTNQLALSGAAPQLVVGDNSSNNNGNGSVSFLTLGQETTIWADSIRIGGQKQQGNMSFNAAFTSPSLVMRGADGSGRVTLIGFGDNGAQAGSGNPTTGTINLGDGTVNVLADTVYVGRGQTGNGGGGATGNLTIGAGTFDVNTFEVGYQNAANAVGTVNGTVNVNNNSLFSTGAVLVVNTSLRLARNAGSAAAVNGTLTVNGGTVVANEIIGGGGNSTINLNAGTLILANTAGTVAAPIRNLNLTDATLHVPVLNAGAPLTTSNLTTLGSQNVFHVTAVPPISAYPVTFPLISYQSGAGGAFVLGTLPAASPAYAGEIVDLGDGVVALRLTSGPIVDLRLTWTGATDGNWDSITPNWLFQGGAASFFPGSMVLFNDSATVSDVVMVESVSPGSMTVSNLTREYAFTGVGGVAASSLSKDGPGTLTLANEGANNFGAVTINSGTLQLGNGGDNGSVVTLNITNHGDLVINRANTLTLSSAISGTGGLTKAGAGALILSGANTYSGTTMVNAGTLLINGTSGSGTLTAGTGTTLGGNGTVNGPVVVHGHLNPGTAGGVGVFKAHGGLALATGSTLTFDLSATDPTNPAANDQVEVQGSLAVNNTTITVNIAGTPQPGSSYLLFTYMGTLSGSFNPVVAGTHFQVALDTSTPGVVYLNVTGDSGFALKWNSQADNLWDSITANWLNLANSTPSVFLAGDRVLFDDTAGVVTDITIGAGTIVSPAVITNHSTANSFTISGAGRISGSAGVVKTGTSTLTLATANDFTGLVDVQEGVLRTGSGSALGTTAGTTTVHPGAALDLNGQNLGGEQVTVSGAGIDGAGVVVNTGGAQGQALRQLVLAGDTTIGGNANWGMNNSGGASSVSSGGSPHKLTKVGPNQVTFSNTSIDGSLGDIDIQEGALQFSGSTASMGEPSLTITVREGAALQFGNNSATWNKQFVLHGNGTTTTVSVGAGGNITFAGPVELHGNCLFGITGPSLNISSIISGTGGITKNGGLPLILTAANTYSGDTLINGGTLQLTGDGSFDSSPNLTLAAGTTLNVSGRTDGALTLATGQSLHGDGTVTGVLNAGAGATISPGVGAVGELTVSGAVTLGGTTRMELDAVNATNDVLRSASSTITYGGTLNLVSLSPLPGGSSYKLFNATSYLGAFSGLNPATPGPGQTWDTSTLNTDGTLKVIGDAPGSAQPIIVSATLEGLNLVISGANGTPNGDYYVLAGTNVVQPLATWERIATNTFNNGAFSFTNVVNPGTLQRYFMLELP